MLFILVSNSLFSQSFDFKNYNVEDGLSQSEVNVIFQDSRGYLWIGTSGGGVCQFDGITFTQYSEKDGLSGDMIRAITEDQDGNLWFASTLGGITKYNGRKFTIYNESDNLLYSSGFNTLFTDDKNRIWIGSNFGLSIYDDGYFKNFEKNALLNAEIYQITTDSKHNTLLATNKGLIIINKIDTLLIDASNGLPSNIITTVTEDNDGNYLIGTKKNGVIKLLAGSIDEKLQLEFEAIPIPSDISITSIIIDNDKEIWFSTKQNGVFVQHIDLSITQLTKENGLKNNNLNCLYQDRSGNLWIGTSGSGIIKLGTKAFTYFENIEGLNSQAIFSILEDEESNLWIGTGDEGIYKYDGKNVLHFNQTNGINGKSVRSSLKDNKGNLWFATSKGLVKYNNGSFTTFTTANGLPSNEIKSLLLDKQNRLWIGTNGYGLTIYDDKTFKVYNKENGDLSHDYIHSLFEDSKGNIWIGTGDGLNKYSNGKFTNYSKSAGFCNNYIGSITEDKHGKLWFGTDRCIVRYDGIDFKAITMKQGLSSNVIYLLHCDKRGNIWVGTNKGLNKITLNSYGQINTIKEYGAPEGFKGIECNSRAIFEDKKGNLWIGTVSGLIKYNPKEDKSNVFEPIIHLNKVKLFFEDVNWLKYTKDYKSWNNLPNDLVLDNNENHLTFEFSGINLTHPEYVQYSFKLEPLDKDWFPSTKKTSATYSNLPPGEYKFLVKARNNEGIWTQEAASFEFTITSPFWQTWWFYLIIFTTIGYILFKVTTFKEKRQIEISKELEKKVRERTILIEKQRDEKEILLKEIHHRVKNNLQVINSLLSIQSSYTDDPKSLALFDEAKNRIRSMALIHEKMYQTGDLAHIDFQDYILALTDDLIRTYSINTDIFLDIKIDEVKFDIDTIIPIGLLLNEIISNTLKYAFIDRAKGKIIIHLTQIDDNTFSLVAGDDGVGMESHILEQEDISLGMELIKIFVEQLDGTIERLEQKGTVYQIDFKSRKKS
jgi:ligand-binding sensor domain-containing protein/two-component sensor histidine kinase